MDKEQIAQRAQELGSIINTLRHTHFTKRDKSELRNHEKFFLFLLATHNKGKPLMPSEAARKLGVTLAAITHRINSLEKQGYIIRSSSPDDRRVVYLSLSDKGTEMVKALKKSYFEKMYGLIEYLGDKDSAEFISLMTKISDYFKKTSDV